VYFAAATLACALGLLHTWTRVAVLDRSYRLGAAREEGVRLARERTTLRLEVDTLRAAARVDREARTKLEMGPAAPDRVVVLRGAPRASRAQPAPGAKAVSNPVPSPGGPMHEVVSASLAQPETP